MYTCIAVDSAGMCEIIPSHGDNQGLALTAVRAWLKHLWFIMAKLE